jgi:hypothetical protein
MDVLSPQALANHSGIGLVDAVSSFLNMPLFIEKFLFLFIYIHSNSMFPIGYFVKRLVSTDILLTAQFGQCHGSGIFFFSEH